MIILKKICYSKKTVKKTLYDDRKMSGRYYKNFMNGWPLLEFFCVPKKKKVEDVSKLFPFK